MAKRGAPEISAETKAFVDELFARHGWQTGQDVPSRVETETVARPPFRPGDLVRRAGDGTALVLATLGDDLVVVQSLGGNAQRWPAASCGLAQRYGGWGGEAPVDINTGRRGGGAE